ILVVQMRSRRAAIDVADMVIVGDDVFGDLLRLAVGGVADDPGRLEVLLGAGFTRWTHRRRYVGLGQGQFDLHMISAIIAHIAASDWHYAGSSSATSVSELAGPMIQNTWLTWSKPTPDVEIEPALDGVRVLAGPRTYVVCVCGLMPTPLVL